MFLISSINLVISTTIQSGARYQELWAKDIHWQRCRCRLYWRCQGILNEELSQVICIEHHRTCYRCCSMQQHICYDMIASHAGAPKQSDTQPCGIWVSPTGFHCQCKDVFVTLSPRGEGFLFNNSSTECRKTWWHLELPGLGAQPVEIKRAPLLFKIGLVKIIIFKQVNWTELISSQLYLSPNS